MESGNININIYIYMYPVCIYIYIYIYIYICHYKSRPGIKTNLLLDIRHIEGTY